MAEPISDARLDEIDGMTSALQWTGCGIQDVRGLVARIRALEAEVATEREARRVAEARAVVEGADAVSARKRTRELNEEVAALRARMEWRLIETAPKDRTAVLLLFKSDIPHEGRRQDLDAWDGIQFVGRHPGLADDGHDIGWSFAAPVGFGGFPDDWFLGWQPLPTPPAPEGETP